MVEGTEAGRPDWEAILHALETSRAELRELAELMGGSLGDTLNEAADEAAEVIGSIRAAQALFKAADRVAGTVDLTALGYVRGLVAGWGETATALLAQGSEVPA